MIPSAADLLKDLTAPRTGNTIEVVQAKNGQPVARRNGRYVDSSHDPEAAARRRLTGLALEGRRLAVVFGDGFGYLARQLVAAGLDVLLIEADPDLPLAGYRALGHAAWAGFALSFCADSQEAGFWEARIRPDLQAPDVLVVPPAAGADPCLVQAAKTLVESLRRRMIDFETTAWFGPQWVINILANLAVLQADSGRVLSPASLPMGGDWVIAVPGPGLDEVLPELAGMRKGCTLLALAPAVKALRAAGLEPDLVCSSDGGWANRLHLAGENLPGVPLVFPLMLAAGIAHAWAGPLVPVSTGTALERQVVSGLPPMGETPSVALFALGIAIACRAGRIVLAGQDFASYSCKTHARGYRFDEDLLHSACRAAPVEKHLDMTWRRRDRMVSGWRADPKMFLYRERLLELGRTMRLPLFRLGSSPFLDAIPAFPGDWRAGLVGRSVRAEWQIQDTVLRDWLARLAGVVGTEVWGTVSGPGDGKDRHMEEEEALLALIRDGSLKPLFELGQAPILRQVLRGRPVDGLPDPRPWLRRVVRRLGILLNNPAGDADR
ncbi:MAG TPA: DUF115 domain-containing protein [Spirochaetota bacterium]|nr:DUF115 domain-containing protein [Spirochaetota bacterium]